jgi:CheY-like chemotaxis protein
MHTILTVDDEEDILYSLRLLLEREGYQVLTANSGDMAWPWPRWRRSPW